jgi:hypothetical protein
MEDVLTELTKRIKKVCPTYKECEEIEDWDLMQDAYSTRSTYLAVLKIIKELKDEINNGNK